MAKTTRAIKKKLPVLVPAASFLAWHSALKIKTQNSKNLLPQKCNTALLKNEKQNITLGTAQFFKSRIKIANCKIYKVIIEKKNTNKMTLKMDKKQNYTNRA
ncbi:MAG: hypothetical protein ACK5L3_03815 [Oscillospiraceae bacterium]